MVKEFTLPVNFLAFNVFYTVGFLDMMLIPNAAVQNGPAKFIGVFCTVLLIYGIPAFSDESAYLMPMLDEMEERRSSVITKWRRCYSFISLMQVTLLSISEAINNIVLAMTHSYTLLSLFESSKDIIEELYSPKCRSNIDPSLLDWTGFSPRNDTLSADREVQHVPYLPSCLTRNRSEIACAIHSLFSVPENILFYCVSTLNVVIMTNAVLFGRSLSTYGAISRVYLSLVVLWGFTLLLHFSGKNMTYTPKNLPTRGNITIEQMFPSALIFCNESLGLTVFCLSIIGSFAGNSVKRLYLLLAIAACLIDTLIAFAFTGLDYMRNAAVQGLCNRNNSGVLIDMDSFMSMPDVSSELLNSDWFWQRFSFAEYALQGAIKMAESVRMFKETSGSTPWTVYVPFEILTILFSVLLSCLHFILTDLLAMRLFRRSKWLVILLMLMRLGAIILVIFFRISGELEFMDNYLHASAQIVFLSTKTIDCFIIHKNYGFTKYISDRRSLLSSTNKLQLFLFDWYIAPASLFLYHAGYPAVLLITLIYNQKSLLQLSFLVFFLSFEAMPIIVIAMFAFFARDDEQ